MMTKGNKIARIISLIILGIWIAYMMNRRSREDFFLDGLLLAPITIIGLVIFIGTVYKEYKEFRITRRLSSYLATYIGLFFLFLNIGLMWYYESRVNSPSLISGFYDGGFNGFSVDFKKDGNYVMANGSGLGQTYFYGKYSIKDSIITIDKSNIDNCIKTNRLLIRIIDSVGSDANYITQIDSNGDEISKEFRFRVVLDERRN